MSEASGLSVVVLRPWMPSLDALAGGRAEGGWVGRWAFVAGVSPSVSLPSGPGP